jgi:hypothetical protein
VAILNKSASESFVRLEVQVCSPLRGSVRSFVRMKRTIVERTIVSKRREEISSNCWLASWI